MSDLASSASCCQSSIESVEAGAGSLEYLKTALMVEYSYIGEMGPPSMYVLPNDDHITWSGIIFVRAGWYRGATHRFRIEFPETYPMDPPYVFFLHPVPFHPLVDESSGELEFPAPLNRWRENDCSTLHVLNFMLSIFYVRDHLKVSQAIARNEKCRDMVETDIVKFSQMLDLTTKEAHDDLWNSTGLPIEVQKMDVCGKTEAVLQEYAREQQPVSAFLEWFEQHLLEDHKPR